MKWIKASEAAPKTTDFVCVKFLSEYYRMRYKCGNWEFGSTGIMFDESRDKFEWLDETEPQ